MVEHLLSADEQRIKPGGYDASQQSRHCPCRSVQITVRVRFLGLSLPYQDVAGGQNAYRKLASI